MGDNNTVAIRAPHVQQTLSFLDAFFHPYPNSNFAFRLWNGIMWQKPDADPARFVIVLNHPAALRRMFLPPSDARMALAYALGDFDIEGETMQALDLGRHITESWKWYDVIINGIRLLRLPSDDGKGSDHEARLEGALHSEDRDKKAIEFHYSMSNEFYSLWLDKRMVYSCAYFHNRTDDIDTAQYNKLELICRKLRLKQGERLLDVGCGWGSLVIHAVTNYGVTAVGVTISEKQAEFAQARIQEAGIGDRCKIEILDYRKVDESEPFDKIVSVGMIEHVGRNKLKTYFEKCFRLLRKGGVFLNHGITLLKTRFKSVGEVEKAFINKYIFPDGDLQPLLFVLRHAAEAGFEIRDVDCLREHYALTLSRWLSRLENHEEEAVKLMGRQTYRLWKMYLLCSEHGFTKGLHTIYQTLLYKATDDFNTQLPLTRTDWYK